MAQLKNTTVSDTGFLQLPVGTTAQRPTPAAGQMRYNTTAGKAEFYNATAAAWLGTAAAGVVATGGTVYDVDTEGTTYRVHVFINTGNSAFTVTKAGPVEYLIVAGGGGGGGWGGGGGAGGLLTGTATVTAQPYTIAVGVGGARGTSAYTVGGNGGNSIALGLTAIGGGGGGRYNNVAGLAGGSGGGGGLAESPATVGASGGPGTSGQGFAGGQGGANISGWTGARGGGGGGAGEVGFSGIFAVSGTTNAGRGGNGINLLISGISTFYGGGGGGHAGIGNILSIGGIGGGGRGGRYTSGSVGTAADDGTTNTGGGGGGSWGGTGQLCGLGGSGIVIVRYPLRQENPVVAAGKTIGDALVLDLDLAKPTVYVGTGTVVNDSRLNGIQGTVFNSSSKATRTHRASFTFNGSSSYIDTNDKLIKTTGGWTVSSWVTTGATVNPGGLLHNFIGSTSYTYNSWFWTILSGRLALWNLSPGAWYYGSTTLLPNTTYQAVLVSNSNGTSYQFYLNGVAEGGDHVSYSWNPSYAGLIIGFIGRGNAAEGRYWLGEYYSLQVWDRVLTAAEVAQQYNATRWRFGV